MPRAPRVPREPCSHYARAVSTARYRASREEKADLIYAICGEWLRRARHVVDLGAGTGIMKRALEGRAARLILGFEIDREFIVERERMAVADLQALPVPDGIIDFGIANHVYEHVANLDRFLAEMRRTLAPGGRIYMTAGNRFAVMEPHYRIPFLSWWPQHVATRILRWTGRGEHYRDIRFTTHRRLVRAAARHGLALEDVTDDVLTAHLELYRSRVGRWMAGVVRSLPRAVRRVLLVWASPQWFFFVRRTGDAT